MNPIHNKVFYGFILLISILITLFIIILFLKTNNTDSPSKDTYNLSTEKVLLSEKQAANKKSLIAEVESKGSTRLSPEEIAKKEKILRELLTK